VFTEEYQEDREVRDDELVILFDRQPRGELDDIRQAGEELRREVENDLRDAVVKLKRVTSDLRSSSKRWTEKVKVASFDSMRFSKAAVDALVRFCRVWCLA
jgi:hypothetical protein